MINVIDYKPLPTDQRTRVKLQIEDARDKGKLRSEVESGVGTEYAIRSFEYACERFQQMRARSGSKATESRAEVRLHLQRLHKALRDLQVASNTVYGLIGDDLYGSDDGTWGMPRRALEWLEDAYPERPAGCSTSTSDRASDPLAWRSGMAGMGILNRLQAWAALAEERVGVVVAGPFPPGRDRGTPLSLLALDLLDLLRLLDRSDNAPVRPVKPGTLREWLDLAFESMGEVPPKGCQVACKHTVSGLGPRASWVHPPRPIERFSMEHVFDAIGATSVD